MYPRLGHIRGLFFTVLIGIIATPVFASGSYSTGGGNPSNQSYNLGKAAFYKKLICSSCPLAQTEPDAVKAAAIVRQLGDQPEFARNLSEHERQAVIQFLKRRYGLD